MLGTLFDLLLVVVGFGLIVVVHELGHFVAARWAGIRVLAFAVGMGPAIVSYRKGMGWRRGSTVPEYERLIDQAAIDIRGIGAPPLARNLANISPTEYRLNYLPFGGYVKMLGQEDGNPNAVSDDSDSYQRCKPWKRLIVISAGVVMNLIAAAALFVLVFMVGMKVDPARIGSVVPGSPADVTMPSNAAALGIKRAGLAPGDTIIKINGENPNSFSDLMLATAMAERGEAVELSVQREGISRALVFNIVPQVGPQTGMLEMGVEPSRSATVSGVATPQDREDFDAAMKSLGLEGLEPGMRLVEVDGKPVQDGTALTSALRLSNGEAVRASFASEGRGKATRTFELVPRPQLQVAQVTKPNGAVSSVEHLLGLMPVMTVAATTPASEAQGLKAGDLFARVGPVEYPNIVQGTMEIQSKKNQSIGIVLLRKDANGGWKEVVLPKITVNGKGQIGFAVGDTGKDLAVISLPLARLQAAGASGPVATGAAENAEGFVPVSRGAFETPGATIVSVDGTSVSNFADLRAELISSTREAHNRHEGATVQVRFRRPSAGVLNVDAPIESLSWTIPADQVTALHELGWESPVGPGLFSPQQVLLKAHAPGDALRMGFAETKRVMLTTYITFARLFQGTVKVEHLKGPVGIAHLGTLVAGKGFIWLLFFLALISVNLAVVNFLPLPIVDGGHFLFILYEIVMGKPVSLGVQSAVTMAGLLLIGSMFLIVTYNDIRNLIGF